MTDDPLQAYVPRLLLRRGVVGPGHWTSEGTLVIADVSGFTRLTEKLSREGRAGGEEIVRTISDVFTILLTATTDGGDVIKFSGDALVLFHDGPDHAQRACHAALTMQRVLRAVGGIDSSRGRVRLRMSIGAHTGRFSFFLCGGDHLELYVLGPGATATVAAEASARAGEVVVSEPTAAALHGATFGPHRGGGRVLRSVPDMAPVRPPPVTSVDSRPFIAPPLRDRLADDDIEPEHRRATIAFVHFGGVDRLLAHTGGDEAFARVQQLTTTAMTALDRYGVLLTATDIGRDGGVLMLTAGAPDTTGDDAGRMLRVARALLDARIDLRLRVGVNTGAVFAGAVGAPLRRTYSTMGAATNLAARVAGAAAWHSVWATAEVLAQLQGRFTVTPVPAFEVRGRAAPVEAGAVGEPLSASTAAADRSIPFVGRHAELATLRAAIDATANGLGGVVEVIGDPGVGRSRLVDMARETAAGVPWLVASCDPYERTVPYRTAARVLRAVLGVPADAGPADAGAALIAAVSTAAPDLLPLTPLLADALRAEVPTTAAAAQVDARYRRERINQAVGDLLAVVAGRRSVLVLEDVEHMDDASAELIAALLARLVPTRPWLVILTRTARTSGLHAGRGYEATVLRVEPLGEAEATELAGRLAEHTPVPVHLLPRLVERAAGNPLFLAALIDAQADGSGELPGSVEAIVASRIDQLDQEDRRALRYLSVLGDRFSVELLDAALHSIGVHSAQTDRWRRLAEFVTRDGDHMRFRNALVREVAYDGLPFRRRRQLHGLVADAMAAAGTAAGRPLHLLRAERWRDAWEAARAAAVRARTAGANATAGQLYDMALRAARRLDLPDADLAAVALDAGEAWERAAMWDRALDAYTVAGTATRDPHAAVQLCLRRARTHEAAGRASQALRLYRRAAAAAADLPAATRDRWLAGAHAGYASTRLGQGRPDDAVAHARQALAHAEAAGQDEVLAQALHLLERAHAARGEHDVAADHRDRALPIFAALDDLAAQGTVLHDLGADAQRLGRLDEALWLFERSHDARTAAGDVVGAAASANAIGEVLIALGRTGAARERLTAALRAWRGARSPQGVAQAIRNLGVVALRDGDAARAVVLLDEAVGAATRAGADELLQRARLPLAEALLEVGRHVEAWEAASEVLLAGDAALHGTARRLRGTALLRTGGFVRARDELRRALEAVTDPGEAELTGRLLAEAGERAG